MSQTPPLPFGEKAAVEIHHSPSPANESRLSISSTATASTHEDEHSSNDPHHTTHNPTTILLTLTTLFLGTILTLSLTLFIFDIHTANSDEPQAQHQHPVITRPPFFNHRLIKRINLDSSNDLMLWIFLGGITIALVCGLTTSWYWQRRMAGVERARKERREAGRGVREVGRAV